MLRRVLLVLAYIVLVAFAARLRDYPGVIGAAIGLGFVIGRLWDVK